ncbi:MAG: hypothetical protein ACXVAQ_06365 [Vulcanimicrobiaceae bacterium]
MRDYMAQQFVDLEPRIESVARYLSHMFTTAGIDRYEDTSRDVVGFHFIGAPHGDIEFTCECLRMLPSDENGLAQELHLRHISAEINETPAANRLIIMGEGLRREPVT